MLKKLLKAAVSFALVLSMATGFVAAGENAITTDATQQLHITGDDWGPGVDKTILTLNATVKAEDLDAENFTVTETKEATDWFTDGYPATTVTSTRNIVDVYLSDAEGNPVNAEEGKIITVEMYISPNEGSPFRYCMDSGYNKWCDPYELDVEGTAGQVTISSDVTFDLTDDTQWFCETADKFDVTKTYEASDGYTYQYGEYVPAEDDGQNALIIWLHGAGEGQAATEEYHNDVYIDLLGNEVPALVSDEFQKLFGGAYVITPQAPTMWMDCTGNGDYCTDNDTDKSVYSEGLFELIQNYVATHPDVDPNRIIIGGCSNGGYMTMREVVDHPGYFYKAYPICEALEDSYITDEQIQAVAESRTGIWFTYALTDDTVDPNENSIPTIERLVAAGADVHYTEWKKTEDLTNRFYQADEVTPYEYMGHWSWIYFDNNANTKCNIDGTENEWEWLAEVSGTQYLHITGDDWGPGVDKTILTLDTTVKAANLDSDNFTVTETKEGTKWSKEEGYPAIITTSERTVLDVYLSDAEGNRVDDAEGNIITVEMYISPSEGSPFRYCADSGFNKWCDPYELDIEGTAGQVTISSDVTFDLTDDTQWFCETADKFDVTQSYKASDGYTYQYGEYVPAEDDGQNALIIWLHGAGEGQAATEEYHNDVYIDLLGNEVPALVSDEFQKLFGGAYVITPQAPTMWMDCTGNGDYCTDNDTDKSVYSEGLFELIQNYVATHPDVDPNRIIIGGCSNGGYMTMREVVDHPGYFYKAYPICEALLDSYITDEQIQAVAESRTGIWFTYALTDTTVDPNENSIPTIKRLVAAGADVHYTEWKKTEDLTGRFWQADEVTPYEYSGHWSWIYFDNNANTKCNIDGTENEWVWLAEEPETVSGTQYLHITGDDWGPGVDKTIVTLDTTVKAADLKAENFTVTEIKENSDWANNPYAACIDTSRRTILDVYLSDANGNKVDAEEGKIITVEMYISPSEGSPFRYVLQSGFNKWCTPYELVVTGNAGKITILSDKTIDLTDNTTWFCETADKFDVTKTYKASDGYTYQYGEYVPAEDDGQNALIIWLHGAGEGQAEGQTFHNDVYVDLLGNEVPALVSDEFQKLFGGAYVITPQAPTMWMDNGTGAYTSDGTSCYSEGLFELIQNYVSTHPDVDPDRIIIGGCSNGGYMTMREIIDHPGYFYKAYPICEALADSCITDAQIKALADSRTGIWFTYALTDDTVDPTVYSIPTIKRLVAAGANVHYTEWEKTEDITGRFYQADEVTPYEYSGHWSWIYFDNNANTKCNIDGTENEWVWLAQYEKTTPVTPDEGGSTGGNNGGSGSHTGTVVPNTGLYGASAGLVAVAGLAVVVALKKRRH